jgi:NADH:ubiquinone oxidoreductase subunit H
MNYRPGAWYWEFVINVRKFLIAFCSLSLRSTPSFQLAIALLVLFIWVRWTVPRFRYDQLMKLGWYFFFELALVNIFITAFVLAYLK